ncbi:DeoR family transcriptional regulator, partial [Actinomadura sp. DSM 109109]|nr:DeoR family transcriptional regulator [Actinomadura lepetitiana]
LKVFDTVFTGREPEPGMRATLDAAGVSLTVVGN